MGKLSEDENRKKYRCREMAGMIREHGAFSSTKIDHAGPRPERPVRVNAPGARKHSSMRPARARDATRARNAAGVRHSQAQGILNSTPARPAKRHSAAARPFLRVKLDIHELCVYFIAQCC